MTAVRDFLLRGECPQCLARRVKAGVVRRGMTLLYGVLFISASLISGCRGIISGRGELHSPCTAGVVIEKCNCGGSLVDTGHCCDGEHQTSPCGEVLDCDLGEVFFDCRCGEEVVSAGYCCREVHQTEACAFKVYYVSSSEGADDNTGLSAVAPWKTLDIVNTAPLGAGDAILFKRDDRWSGTVTVSASGTEGNPITYGAYEAGAKPKIYGSEEITGWTLHLGNIYKATFDTPITQLFVEGVKMRPARLSNTGYSIITSVPSQTQFTSDDLDAGLDYADARVLLRTSNWYSIMRTVVFSSSKTLTLDSAPDGTLAANQGFLLMNKLEFLDSQGEWYQDTAEGTVYLWFPDGVSPEHAKVRGSSISDGIYLYAKSHVALRNLHILQQKEKGIRVGNGCHDLEITDNLVEGQEKHGLWAEGTNERELIANNHVDDCNGIGIYMWIKNSIVRDNTVTRIGEFEKLGLHGTAHDNGGTGMEINGDGNTIEYNRVVGVNYNGIFWRGNSLLQYNFIKDSGLVKSDGGGIYTGGVSTSGSLVRYNIIDNVVGEKSGYTYSRNYGEGLYLDEPSRNITAEYNTITRVSDSGIFLHNSENHLVRCNTVMDARQGIQIGGMSGTAASQVTDNLIVVHRDTDDYLPRQLVVSYANGNARFDDNTYVCPFESDLVFRDSDGSYLDFEDWKTFIAGDESSTYVATSLDAGETQEMFYNDTKGVKSFTLDGSYRDLQGAPVVSPLTLQPFTSQILIRE